MNNQDSLSKLIQFTKDVQSAFDESISIKSFKYVICRFVELFMS